ncbi:hypothetical protein GQR36_00105 [Enterococcus termitis]
MKITKQLLSISSFWYNYFLITKKERDLGMKKKFVIFLLFVGLSIFYFPQLSNAEPAEMRGFVELSQPTKQSFKAEIRGDEWLSYAVVEDTQELLILGEKIIGSMLQFIRKQKN